MSSESLLPCPFCGSEKVENWGSQPPRLSDRLLDNNYVWCVFCHDCLCEGPETLTEAEAALKWNITYSRSRSEVSFSGQESGGSSVWTQYEIANSITRHSMNL